MLIQEEKSKIDKIWLDFHSNGVAIPSDVMEQLTYLLFMRQLDEIETSGEEDAEMLGEAYQYKIFKTDEQQSYRWKHITKISDTEKLFKLVRDDVFEFIKSIGENPDSAFAKYMKDAVFKIPTPLALDKIIKGISELDLSDEDSKGDLYEYMLSKMGTSKINGQFRTPRHIIKMMVDIAAPSPHDIVVDPAMGSAGFLVAAEEYIRSHHNGAFMDEEFVQHFHNNMFHGFDNDTTMLRIGAMNMMLHDLADADIAYKSSLSKPKDGERDEKDKYTLVLANPPFKGTLDNAQVNPELLKITKSKHTELLFLALFLRSLSVGGRAVVIVPGGVVFREEKDYMQIRKAIIDDNRLEAVIDMPSGVFQPYSNVSTNILIFTKTNHGGTDKVWFYKMEADGFSLDKKRTEVEENDIPDLLARWGALAEEEKRSRKERSFMVPVEEIRAKDYRLSFNTYMELDYTPEEYPPTEQLFEEIKGLFVEISNDMKKFEEMI